MPDTQDFFPGGSQPAASDTSAELRLQLSQHAVERHATIIASALFALINLVEHNMSMASRLGLLRYDAAAHRFVPQPGALGVLAAPVVPGSAAAAIELGQYRTGEAAPAAPRDSGPLNAPPSVQPLHAPDLVSPARKPAACRRAQRSADACAVAAPAAGAASLPPRLRGAAQEQANPTPSACSLADEAPACPCLAQAHGMRSSLWSPSHMHRLRGAGSGSTTQPARTARAHTHGSAQAQRAAEQAAQTPPRERARVLTQRSTRQAPAAPSTSPAEPAWLAASSPAGEALTAADKGGDTKPGPASGVPVRRRKPPVLSAASSQASTPPLQAAGTAAVAAGGSGRSKGPAALAAATGWQIKPNAPEATPVGLASAAALPAEGAQHPKRPRAASAPDGRSIAHLFASAKKAAKAAKAAGQPITDASTAIDMDVPKACAVGNAASEAPAPDVAPMPGSATPMPAASPARLLGRRRGLAAAPSPAVCSAAPLRSASESPAQPCKDAVGRPSAFWSPAPGTSLKRKAADSACPNAGGVAALPADRRHNQVRVRVPQPPGQSACANASSSRPDKPTQRKVVRGGPNPPTSRPRHARCEAEPSQLVAPVATHAAPATPAHACKAANNPAAGHCVGGMGSEGLQAAASPVSGAADQNRADQSAGGRAAEQTHAAAEHALPAWLRDERSPDQAATVAPEAQPAHAQQGPDAARAASGTGSAGKLKGRRRLCGAAASADACAPGDRAGASAAGAAAGPTAALPGGRSAARKIAAEAMAKQPCAQQGTPASDGVDGEHPVDTAPAPAPETFEATFLDFLCSSVRSLGESRAALHSTSDHASAGNPALATNLNDGSSAAPPASANPGDRRCTHELELAAHEGAAGRDNAAESDLAFVALHAALLLGLLVFRWPAARPAAAARVPLPGVARDMAHGLDFYARQGAASGSSAATLQAAIRSLCA
jgi:hypothetical protein